MIEKNTIRKIKFLICPKCENIYFLDKELEHLNKEGFEFYFNTWLNGCAVFDGEKFSIDDLWTGDAFSYAQRCLECEYEEEVELYIGPTEVCCLPDPNDIIKDQFLIEAEVDFDNRKVISVKEAEGIPLYGDTIKEKLEKVLFG